MKISFRCICVPFRRSMSKRKSVKKPKIRSVFYDNVPLPDKLPPVTNVGQSTFYEEEARGTSSQADQEKIASIQAEKYFRLLWSETDPVLNSGVLESMTQYERALQESKFEIITTEVTYLNAINVLMTSFYESKDLFETCSRDEFKQLFGNIVIVKAASELLLKDLVSHWETDIMLVGIYPVIRNHSSSVLKVYIEYCRNLPNAMNLLQKLWLKNENFHRVVTAIESCFGNSLQSYLALPMQRITRLPLLLEAIISRLRESTPEHTACRLAIASTRALVKECNEAVEGHEKVVQPFSTRAVSMRKHKEKQPELPRTTSWTSYTTWNI